MIQERMGPLITHAVQGDVEPCLFHTEGQEEGIWGVMSDYLSAYRIMLGNYCSFSVLSVMTGTLG